MRFVSIKDVKGEKLFSIDTDRQQYKLSKEAKQFLQCEDVKKQIEERNINHIVEVELLVKDKYGAVHVLKL